MKWLVSALGILFILTLLGIGLVAGAEAQQRQPYTTYQLPYQQCLVITAQGYAVVLDYPCQH